jgi:GntR family transcriptional regulator
MQLSREAPNPLYLQLKDTLVADIKAGRYHVHQRLPSERELSERYKVSRMTARQALLDLAREGLVYTRVGKGTFVADSKIDQQLRTVTGFSQDIRARGSQPSSVVLEAKIIPATPEVASALHILIGADVITLARVRLADGKALAVETAYLPSTLCPNLLQHDFSIESLYHILEKEYGFLLTQADQTIEASLATTQEAELLKLTPPAAMLHMERLTVRQDGQPIEYVLSTYRGDRYKFRSQLQPRSTSR